jgi:ribosomal protein uS17
MVTKNTVKKTIGMGIEVPQNIEQTDRNCPFTGELAVRGNIFSGEVISTSAALTATVKVERKIFVPKYKRYKNRIYKTHVHNPLSINAQVGDIVEYVGCRPISKTKSSVIVRVVKKHEGN